MPERACLLTAAKAGGNMMSARRSLTKVEKQTFSLAQTMDDNDWREC